MRPPFPGMDPWLEHPAIWPDVHNSLIAAIREELAETLAPKYYVSIEERMSVVAPPDVLPPRRPDLAIVEAGRFAALAARPGLAVTEEPVLWEYEVELPLIDWYLVVYESTGERIVTVIELLSRVNKNSLKGRKAYLRKRNKIRRTQTNLVEVDLLRSGRRMDDRETDVTSHYRTIICRGQTPLKLYAYLFSIPQPIPLVPIPLLPEDGDVVLNLNTLLHSVYEKARYDLRIDYTLPPIPPLDVAVDAWARGILAE